MTTLLHVARSALKSGLNVLPPKENGSKRPDATEWTTRQTILCTEQEIDAWYASGDREGIGIICGTISGGLEVLDFDCMDTWHAFAELVDDRGHGDLLDRIADGYLEQTPRPGIHLLYRCTSTTSTKLAAQSLDTGVVKTLIETKGEGGYVIVAPTAGRVHSSGKPYRLLSGSFFTIATLDESERQVLHDIARSLDMMPPPAFANSSTGERPGDDFNRRVSWSDILMPHGWQQLYNRSGREYWQRPGKEGDGCSATISENGQGVLYVFSTSTSLESGRSYDRFGAYAVLNHGGDLAAAASELASKGYGRKTSSPSTPRVVADRELPDVSLNDAMFHGLAGEIVRTVDLSTEAHPVAILVQLLTAFGNAVGRGPHFVVEQKRHHANLFSVLVGETSKARKGSSWSRVRGLIADADPEWEAKRIVGGLSSGEGLMLSVQDSDNDPNADKRLLVIEEEFTNVLRVSQRDGNTLSAVIRQAWDGDTLATLTKNTPIKATKPHISIIGHITKEELNKRLRETDAANGFANRLLWCGVRRSKLLPHGGVMNDKLMSDLSDRLKIALTHARSVGEIERDGDANALWTKVYGDLSEGRPGLIGAICGRAEAQVMRLALIFALIDRAAEISALHLQAALALWRYSEDSVHWAFSDAFGDPLADRLLAALQHAGSKGKTKTELSAVFSRNVKAIDIDRALQSLCDVGRAYCKRETPDNTGRFTAERWFHGQHTS